ncbi:LPS export ABC transporter periplasmic protein LptC [Salegentibacter salarius]|uniref:LPS export ABC transporter periplasmic protein LptC n=1 Tax=Salegentibacter salarius TaxID=435906 RepID=A0A2N0TWJ4_9FLAO|nr:LPS export ABC transporter periplasmic protein LptC [Salegentibacter salarius]OEY72738.1 LPS export ABC transporter periplasmic protein LptC [Salegentibacter salarius]PKD19132.1 LPS export ABC transporter periplasmic protein LptC [Salegentibacter salarius]SLK00242.1 LPS export ABC transporter protein LptC [Salegentibacter salarius]
MRLTYKEIITGIVTLIGVTMLFSCQGNLNEIRALDIEGDAPQAIAEGINLKYTDSGRMVANLKSPKMKDFTNKEFPYREFPEGLELEIYDENNEKSTVTSDYGIIYDGTNLIDLQGNVVIFTADSMRLEASQLYWDQNINWIFTDKPNTIKFPNGALNEGEGFDANQNFGNFRSRTNVGVQIIKDDKPDE